MLIYNPDTNIAVGFSPKCASTSIRHYGSANGWRQLGAPDVPSISPEHAYFIVRDPRKRFPSSIQMYVRRWAVATGVTIQNHWEERLPKLRNSVVAENPRDWYVVDSTHFIPQSHVMNKFKLNFELVKLENLHTVLPDMDRQDNTSNAWLKQRCDEFAEEFAEHIPRLYTQDFQLYDQAR